MMAIACNNAACVCSCMHLYLLTYAYSGVHEIVRERMQIGFNRYKTPQMVTIWLIHRPSHAEIDNKYT